MTDMEDDFMARGARIRGVERRASRFKQGHTDALWLGGREIAHCHRGYVDVRLMRAGVRELRDELRGDARIDLRGPGYDWILVRVRNPADVDRAIELLRYAMRAAGDGVSASPAPSARSRARTRPR